MTATIWQLGSLSSGDITAKVDIFNTNDPVILGHNLLNSRFGAIWLKIHHSTRIEHEDTTLQWIKDFRSASQNKIRIGGWGVLETDPIGEASLVKSLIDRYQLAAYIADAEGPHKQDWPGGDITRTNLFCKKFRELLPLSYPFGWSSFAASFAPYKLGDTRDVAPNFSGPMDYHAPFKYGARWIPQIYPNESGLVYSNAVMVDHAIRSHWPLNLTHPWLGCYPSNSPYDPRAYVAEMRALKLLGFNVFRIEQMTQGDWNTLNSAIGVGPNYVALPRA